MRVRHAHAGVPDDVDIEADWIFANGMTSRAGMAFTALHDFGSFRSDFQGNVNLGLLVLAAFNVYPRGSKHSDCFSREFFYLAQQTPPADGPALPPPVAHAGRPLAPSHLVGEWLNTNRVSAGVRKIEISGDGDGLRVHTWGGGEPFPDDLGETRGELFGFDLSAREAMAFSACHDTGNLVVSVQANIKQGVLVVAYFTRFQDDTGRSNFFSREFYYRNEGARG